MTHGTAAHGCALTAHYRANAARTCAGETLRRAYDAQRLAFPAHNPQLALTDARNALRAAHGIFFQRECRARQRADHVLLRMIETHARS